jgi:DNA polymerase-1
MPWTPLTKLPDLRRVGIVALDTETCDDRLRADLGSGWFCKAGHLCGFSAAYRADGAVRSFYAPLRHPDSENFDSEKAFAWLRDLLASDVRVVTQKGLYDYRWLRADAGIIMPSPDRLEEIGAMAATIDENRLHYDLDSLCAWRGIPGKNTAELQAGAAAIGLPKKANVRANIWRLPACYVGTYAEADAAATLLLFENLDPLLDQENTRSAYRLDVELLPLVHEMRRRGIRIDADAAVKARDTLIAKRDAVLAELADNLGTTIGIDEIHGRKWLVSTFDRHKIIYPRTAKGNPSFRAGQSGWLDRHDHWLPRLVAKAKRYHHAAINFVDGHILKHLVAGRIHSELHPFRAEDGGAKSSRFSYSDPPLQQMPSRDPEIGLLIRSAFLPEEGEIWLKPDASQQEFRLLVHYAESLNLAGAHEAAEKYRTDPRADFHSYAAGITGLDRSAAKNVNFAKIYGAREKKFSQMINKSLARQPRSTINTTARCRSPGSCPRYAKKRWPVTAISSCSMALAAIGPCGRHPESGRKAPGHAITTRRCGGSTTRRIPGMDTTSSNGPSSTPHSMA